MIFVIRFLIALCLFAFLGRANIDLTVASNVVLSIGYRSLLILSPFFTYFLGKFAIAFTLFLACIGTVFMSTSSELIMVLGALAVGTGLSVSGYLIKFYLADTPMGAASNKIALNLGSVCAGLVLIFYTVSKGTFFLLAAGIFLILSLYIVFKPLTSNKHVAVAKVGNLCLKRFIGWGLLGVCIGVKLFGVFSVLPQYLLQEYGTLPNWYGSMIIVNSLAVIILQVPIIKLIERIDGGKNTFLFVLILLILGLFILSVPQLFYAKDFWGAIIWVLILSVVECAASYFDVWGTKSGYLLVKESCVGLGAGLAVFVSRIFNFPVSSYMYAALAAVFFIAIYYLLKSYIKGSDYTPSAVSSTENV